MIHMRTEADPISTALVAKIPFGIQNPIFVKPLGNIRKIYLFAFFINKGKVTSINLIVRTNR